MLSGLRSLASAFARPRAEELAPADFDVVTPRELMNRAFRRPFFRRGTLVFDDGQRLTIAVKDLSIGGARVEYYERTTLPDEVMLCEPSLRLRCRARVVWQIDHSAGLQFIAAA